MFTEEQRVEILRLIDCIQNDTDPVRLRYVVSELITLSHELYPVRDQVELPIAA